MNAYLLFEQSGTFKNQFIKLGFNAFDYDIQNEFNETDVVIDLFIEIEKAYNGLNSIFDKFTCEDVVMAFFPCVRFEHMIRMHFIGHSNQQQNASLIDKLEYDLILEKERAEFFGLITKLAIIALKKGFPLIIENPDSYDNYLKLFWCIPCTIVDRDRTKLGDFYNKPTQYWFINCKPKNNFVFLPLSDEPLKKVCNTSNKTKRSMISSEYANRFIRQFIIDDRSDNRIDFYSSSNYTFFD